MYILFHCKLVEEEKNSESPAAWFHRELSPLLPIAPNSVVLEHLPCAYGFLFAAVLESKENQGSKSLPNITKEVCGHAQMGMK